MPILERVPIQKERTHMLQKNNQRIKKYIKYWCMLNLMKVGYIDN